MEHWFPYPSYEALGALRGLPGDPAKSSPGRIAVVGLPGSPQRVLCNSLWGWDAAGESAESVRAFGLFTLIDLPLESYDASQVMYRLENADLIIAVLDGTAGLTAPTFNWIARLRSVEAALLVVLSETDDQSPEEQAASLRQIEDRLARPVLPLDVSDPESVREKLIPAMLKLAPALAVPLANEIPALCGSVARQVVLHHALACMTTQTNDLPGDHAPYLGVQTRMIRQIAAVYGYKERDRQRERTGLALLMRWTQRYGATLVEHFTWLENWLRPGLVSTGSTLVLGYLAILVYGGYLPTRLHRFVPIVGGTRHGTHRV